MGRQADTRVAAWIDSEQAGQMHPPAEYERQSSPGTTVTEHQDTVLLIDDNAIQSIARQAVLRRSGYTVLMAHDPQQALAQLQRGQFTPPPDAIITDHIMPELTGSQFVRELRKTHPDLPVMVISGLDDAEPEYAAMNVLFLQKPLLPDLLLINLRALLNRKPLKQEHSDAPTDVESAEVACR